MICKCGKYGIYWKNLHTISPYTYCPHCKQINSYIEEELKEESEEK